MALISWIQWTEKVVGMNHATETDVVNRPLREYLSAIGLNPDGDITPPSTGVVNENVYYVGKHGNDANSGRNLANAFLTFGAAISAAPNGSTIACLDSGQYDEAVTLTKTLNIFAPHAQIRAPVGSGTTALDLSQTGSDGYYVIGTVRHTGNQPGRNYCIKLNSGEYSNLYVRKVIMSGTNLTGINCFGDSAIHVDEITMDNGNDSIGIRCASEINLDVGRIKIAANNTSSPGPIAVLLDSCDVSGSIGRINAQLNTSEPGDGISSVASASNADLVIGTFASAGLSTLYNAINVSAGSINLRIGRLASIGDIYKVSAGVLNLFALSLSGTTSVTGGTVVAKQVSDIP